MVGDIFAHKGSQYFDYRSMLLHSIFIIQDASSKIDDAPLTLILRR